ncbi:hypothetical protein [Kibdelosporangium philippinense]|uniref:hypothetical protein n=1 Tax=Kibdelosporangium philippinense TaxID=211113 RepID=UPI00360C4A2B
MPTVRWSATDVGRRLPGSRADGIEPSYQQPSRLEGNTVAAEDDPGRDGLT